MSAIRRLPHKCSFVFASANFDILHYLQPDMIVYTNQNCNPKVLFNKNHGKRTKVHFISYIYVSR